PDLAQCQASGTHSSNLTSVIPRQMAVRSHGNTPSVSATNRYHTGRGVLHLALEFRRLSHKILRGIRFVTPKRVAIDQTALGQLANLHHLLAQRGSHSTTKIAAAAHNTHSSKNSPCFLPCQACRRCSLR
ncbi:MAG: hypothetical protein AB8B85_08085, partial [Paracoccaceae bacterium]